MPNSNGKNEWLLPKRERPSQGVFGEGYLRTFNLAMIALIAAAVIVIAFVAIAVLGRAPVPAVDHSIGLANDVRRAVAED